MCDIPKRTVTEMINAEHTQEHELRVPLLKDIGYFFQSTVVTLYSTHEHWQGTIGDQDAEMLNDVLSATGKTSSLLLIIDSPGGDPLAAERIINICKSWSNSAFATLVPGKAKSAATIICLGSNKINMTPVSELGPIDVQIPWGNRLLPAHVVIKSFEDLVDMCVNTPHDKRVEPFLQQLQGYNAAQIDSLRLTRDLSHEIAKKVMQDGMLFGKIITDWHSLLGHFLDPEALKSHGRPIFYTDIKKIDPENNFKVSCISVEDSIYQKIHEYHQRAISHMRANGLSKLCETERASFKAPITGG